MKLASLNPSKNRFDFLRELSPEEIALHDSYTPLAVNAREHLSLFRILEKNFLEWRNFLKEILTPGYKEAKGDTSEELNRLLLNYLTFAYSIQQHFEGLLKRKFRKSPKVISDYKAFLNKLCIQIWPFAFILDFRGYVQHQGLAISHFRRSESANSISIFIEVYPDQLVGDGRDWPKSNLQKDHGVIDLIKTLQEFHIQVVQSYGGYVAKILYPELKRAAEFYANLTAEVHLKDTNARMFFSDGDPVTENDGVNTKFTINYTEVPNDLLAEVGLRPLTA